MYSENYIFEYYQQIKDGRITAGRWVHALYEMILKGLEDKLFFYDQKKANKAVAFVERFTHHSKGRFAPNRVKLELWQKALLACIFGIVDENGIRQFREVLIVIGRKTGKTLLASGIAEYMAYADGEHGADTYFLAPKLDQTDIVWNDFWQSINDEPDLLKRTVKRKSDIYIASTNTQIKKIAFSSKKSDGFNPHLTVCDEVAAWQGDPGVKQYEVMTSALGSRLQPLILSITTANYVNDGIYDELIKRATRVLLGESKEARLLPVLYMIDDVNKWNDISELQKSLPNLGVSVSVDFILEEIAKAEQSLACKNEFLCKYCNIKQNSSQAWLRSADIEKACDGGTLTPEMFKGSYCVAGIDLSQTTDLTAANVVIEKNGRLYILSKFFLPSEKIEEATERDGIPYAAYVKRGILVPSGTNFIDYADVFAWFKKLVEDYEILPLKVGYDRYSSQYLIQDMRGYGFQCDDVYQGTNLYPVMQEFEGLLKDGKICIGDNDLLKAHMLNAAMKLDVEQNKGKLVKIAPNEHIDGMAALLDSLCVRQKWFSEIGSQLKNTED